uniref:pollen receptor-like kinase 3 n=1 Tax=Erigeron canadensis TaxID=72917 RepID=UPI001CB893BA|nr:pollen receptor-like kinase 3 [Erigeron canadensis]
MGLQGTPNVAAFAPLEYLESISLQNNSLVGPIPAFNLVPSLKAIYASKNQFTGVIPPDYFQPLGSLKRIWLSDNKFSGPIPKSLQDLTYLRELHLENNEFSGPIPDFSESVDALNALDLSNNKLEGPIPRPLNRFDKEAFDNNPDLCGPKASKDCPATSQPVLAKKLLIAAIVVAFLLLVMSLKDKRKEENMRILRKQNNYDHEAAANTVVTIPSSSINNSSRKSSSRKGGYSSLQMVKSKSKVKSGPVGELVMVNQAVEKGIHFKSEDLMKASAEVLGNGALGSAYKAMLENGGGVSSVVLKKIKHMNTMSKDVFDAEMRKLGRLKHHNILTPLAYHFRKEDKFLVYEYVPNGSLHNLLHGAIKQSELSWPNRLKMIKGVARGMGYLHSELASYDLPHGNLKSCNVLMGPNYEPLLSDYALHPLINATLAAQSMFAYRSPEAMHRQQVSHKSDVYCLGIVILEMVTGKYPSQYLMIHNNNQKGESGTDVVQWVRSALDEKREGELIDPDLLTHVGQIQKLLHIGAACTETEVDTRIDIKEALKRIEDI